MAPVVEKSLLCIAGTPERPVRNLRLKGIHVAHVDRPLPPYGFAAQFGCLELLEGAAPKGSKRYRWIDAAVSLRNARGCRFLDGGVAHVGGIGLSLLGGCADVVVEGNDFYDLGGGAVVGGAIRNRDTWRWADPLLPGEQKGYRIANNHVHDCGIDYFGAVGILLGQTQEAVVAHNLIHDIAYAGIVLCGNEAPGPPFARTTRSNTTTYTT